MAQESSTAESLQQISDLSSTAESPQRRSGLLRDQVQLSKKKHCDRYEIVPIPESLSFDKGFYIVIRACQLLAQKNEGIIFVGVAGPSGAGKTVFTENVLGLMPSVAVLSMDNYNDASRIIDGNFDDPRLTDYETLLENIHGLKEGNAVQVPIYNFKASCRTGYRTVEAPSSRIVIIEGIYALSEKLRPLLDLRVSVTGGIHFDLVKRVLRDMQRAGQEPKEIIQQVSETVYPMYKAFIEPDLQTAQIKIINKFNPFSGFQNPMYILKSTRTLTVDKVKAVISKEHTEKIDEIDDIYLLPPGEDPETCQSYLRMRNRDGTYNLMFEEWVTDNPFIISPRISFEVSVRLLGGLMALGYTIAARLKRSSHVFSDDKVNVKIDWLEKLNRHYVQVQGRDRLSVKYVAEKLGLEGSYNAHTYIEQIQLENLVKEVRNLPDDLMEKLNVYKELISYPTDVFSKTFSNGWKRKHLKSGMSHSYSGKGEKGISDLTRLMNVTDRGSEGRITSLAAHPNEVISRLEEQISTLNERLDDFTSQMEGLSLKLSLVKPMLSQKDTSFQNDLNSSPKLHFPSELEKGTLLRTSSSYARLVEFPPMEEVDRMPITVITQGQRQIMQRLDNLSRFVHEHLSEAQAKKKVEGRPRILDADLIWRPVIVVLAVGGLGILACKYLKRN